MGAIYNILTSIYHLIKKELYFIFQHAKKTNFSNGDSLMLNVTKSDQTSVTSVLIRLEMYPFSTFLLSQETGLYK